ncbi:hypothetical protein Droror1_Dr00023795 [Drosera rotundifolia]
MDRAKGIKVHDDPRKLKESIKKEEKKHNKSKEKWEGRVWSVEAKRKERHEKRRENVKAKIEQKKMRKIEKRKKKLMRPGFEGRKEGFIAELAAPASPTCRLLLSSPPPPLSLVRSVRIAAASTSHRCRLLPLCLGAKGFSGDDDGRWGLSIDGVGGSCTEVGSLNGVVSSPKQPFKGSSHGETASKVQMVGWPPIRSFRRNTMASASAKHDEDDETEEKCEPGCCLYVKVSMDGAPYLRKVDLSTYRSYAELSSALEKMFRCFIAGRFGSNGSRGCRGLYEICASELPHDSDYVLTYEDKDGDWMLVGDVPWKMFATTCRRLRIMKGADAIGLGVFSTSVYDLPCAASQSCTMRCCSTQYYQSFEEKSRAAL